MIVLGSTYLPMMEALARELAPGDVLRPFDPDRPLADQVADVDVLIIGAHRVDAAVMAAAPRLRLLQQHGSGVNSVDRDEAARRGIAVANVPGANSVAVAEHALALMFHLARRFGEMAAAIAAREAGSPAGIELSGRTLGIVGLGGAGSELAKRASVLGMRVLATKARPEMGPAEGVAFVGGPSDLPRLLQEADFVCLLAALSAQTRGMIGAAEFRLMRPAAYLINVARAPLVDYGACYEALSQKRIAGAAFDVFWREPADPADKMLALRNFTLTPHVAGFSDISMRRIAQRIARNVTALREGRPLIDLV